MKIRNGFVSNSSSSSFVIYGIILKNTIEIKYHILKSIFDYNKSQQEMINKGNFYDFKYEHENLSILIGDDDGVGDNIIIGIILADGDGFYGLSETTIEELDKKIKPYIKKLGLYEKLKIFTGTRSC